MTGVRNPSIGARGRPRETVTVAVQVPKEHAGLVRSLVDALGDPGCEAATRELVQSRAVPKKPKDFKAFLASVPLEGIELGRSRDLGRGLPF